MKDTGGGLFKEEPLTQRDHYDPDKHWIGESLPVPTQSEIAATIGTAARPGDSPFPARADHTHKIATLFLPVSGRYVDAGPNDGAGAAWVTWLSPGTITIPSGATKAIVVVAVAGFIATTTGVPVYLARVGIGGVVGNQGGRLDLEASTTKRHNTSWVETFTTLPTGVASLSIQVNRQSGTGACRADAGTILTWSIWYSF